MTILLGSPILQAQQQPAAPPPPMSFFVTSVGKGDGANLGGLAGADAHCTALATAVGANTGRTWHAYLSTSAVGATPAVNVRDRIGPGPWFNVRGARIAQSVADLHGDTLEQAQLGNNLHRSTAYTEKNTTINGVGDQPNQHDILTGSTTAGRAYADGNDHSCSNWTSNAAAVAVAAGTPAPHSAQVGHHDRNGGGNTSWNSAHPSRGCDQPGLVSTGGAGLFYCFAITNP
ncbi:MAG: lectin [Alphaproteobacteria bacterium]|nr:lectin [Alphaproteobacteria bacterium]